jgi:hypothetical protein
LWIAFYPFEKAVKIPGAELWMGCAPCALTSWKALGKFTAAAKRSSRAPIS